MIFLFCRFYYSFEKVYYTATKNMANTLISNKLQLYFVMKITMIMDLSMMKRIYICCSPWIFGSDSFDII